MSQAHLAQILTYTKSKYYGSTEQFSQQRISYWESTGNLNADDFLLAIKLLDQQVKVGDLAVVKFKYLTALHRKIRQLERRLKEKDDRIKGLRDCLGLTEESEYGDSDINQA